MTRVLTRADVVGLVQPHEVVSLVEQAHADLTRGTAVLGPPDAMPLDGTDKAFIPMSAVSARHQMASVKLLADMPSNRDHMLATQRSTIMLVSTRTGECEAILDGRVPTLLRTAAASAVATRHLARPRAEVLGLLGAGSLAIEHVRAIRTVREIRTVLVWSRSRSTAARFVEEAALEGVDVVTLRSAADVVADAHILCTLTPSREPVVEGGSMSPGLHVNAVGAPPRPDHREIDSVGVKRARIVVDSSLTIHETGDLVIPLGEGVLTPADLSVELGDVVSGRAPGRISPEEITLFKSVGIGLQDLALSELLVSRARATGVGHEVDLTA
jgi:alanine dehydrogenase